MSPMPEGEEEKFADTKGQSETVNRRRTDSTMAKKEKVQTDKQQSTKHYTEN